MVPGCSAHKRAKQSCGLCQSIIRATRVARVIEAEDNPILPASEYAARSVKPMHRETLPIRPYRAEAFATLDGRRTKSVEAILNGWCDGTPPEIIRAVELRIAYLRPSKAVEATEPEPETWSEWRARTGGACAVQRRKGAYLPMRVHNDAHGAAQAWYAKNARA